MVQEFERLIGCLGIVYQKSLFVFDLSLSHFQFRTYVEKRRDNDEDIGQGTLIFLPPPPLQSLQVGQCVMLTYFLSAFHAGSSSVPVTPVRTHSRFAMSVTSPRLVSAALNSRLTLSAMDQSESMLLICFITHPSFQFRFTITCRRKGISIPRQISTQHCITRHFTTMSFLWGC